MDIALLAHDQFPDRAKTALGVLRYGDQTVRAVIDRGNAGDRVSDHVPDVPDAPIVESMADVPPVDALVIGIAPIGGGFEESWRPDVRAAIQRGCDVIAGLHYFLGEDPEFADLAAEHDCELLDLRRAPEDLSVAEGTAGEVDADVVLTVGTDCSTGKMTASYELRDAARERGVDATVVPTGQTGVLIEGWGIVVDRVVADFAAGAVERLVERAATDHDLLIVEGQGALGHPAYSGVTTSIVHGSRPDRLVLCHVAGRESVHGYEATQIPPVADYADRYEEVGSLVHDTEVVAGMLNTQALDERAAASAVESYADRLGVPATDPVRWGIEDDLLEGVV